MVILPLQEHYYVIRLKRKYTKKRFLRFCNVERNSYGETFALRIYNNVIEHAIDIRQEYKKYYSDEYQSIQDFLFWRYCVPDTCFDELFEDYKGSSYIGIFRDYSYFWDEEGDLMSETILRLLEELDK